MRTLREKGQGGAEAETVINRLFFHEKYLVTSSAVPLPPVPLFLHPVLSWMSFTWMSILQGHHLHTPLGRYAIANANNLPILTHL